MAVRLRLGGQAGRLAPEGGGTASGARAGLAAALFALAVSGVTTAASGQVADTATPNLVASPAPDLDPPLKHIPLSSLKATRERPLFSPSRRPPLETVAEPAPGPAAPPPPPAPAPSIPRPNLTLVGTVTSTKGSFAIFTDAATQDTIRLRMGEAREGWTLASIAKRAATLTNGDQAFTVEFPANADPSEPPQPAADDDETPMPAWQARHQAQAAANGVTPLRPPPGGAPTQVQPPTPPPILRRKFHP